MNQNTLFEADDRPERELGWIYNPSAPATDEELREFFKSMQATHSTVSTLRQKYGLKIENRMRRYKGGVMLSEYMIEEEVK